MTGLLLQKLERLAPLSEEDRQALRANMLRVQRFGPREELRSQGESARHINLVLEGWACRYKQFEDGRRQIVSFFLPGDICDPALHLIPKMTHALAALTTVTTACFNREELLALTSRSHNLERALWFETLLGAEIQREWTVSLGRRNAMERLAHLFCELPLRMKAVGLSNGTECDMLATQNDLGDALGMSPVHISRTLQELRGAGLVEVRGRRLTIVDEKGLREVAMFDPSYLCLLGVANL